MTAKHFKCSGREIPKGVDDTIGINRDLKIGVGYDSQPSMPDADWIEDGSWDKLTREEALELADIAIECWMKLKEKFSK